MKRALTGIALGVITVSGLAACNPLPPGCERQGTHGVVVCHRR